MVRFDGGEQDSLAPVIPLFPSGGRVVRAPDVSRPPAHQEPPAAAWRTTWDDDESEDDEYADDGYDECAAIEREIAERNLLKKLRTRSLSVSEARTVVAERDLDTDAVENVLQAFLARGYLDDAALAEQLVHAGVDRKGQGRRVIAQTLAKRGIPRDVSDAALAALPDDDSDRALEYARSKAHGMRDLERDVAVRRLVGQLARRGYGGSVALDAAKQALDEAGSTSGVRFR